MTSYQPKGNDFVHRNEDGHLVYKDQVLDTTDLLENLIEELSQQNWEFKLEKAITDEEEELHIDWYLNLAESSFNLNDVAYWIENCDPGGDRENIKNELKRWTAMEDLDRGKWEKMFPNSDYFWETTDKWRSKVELTGDEMDTMGLLDDLPYNIAKVILKDTWEVKVTTINYEWDEEKKPLYGTITKQFEWGDGLVKTLTYQRDHPVYTYLRGCYCEE